RGLSPAAFGQERDPLSVESRKKFQHLPGQRQRLLRGRLLILTTSYYAYFLLLLLRSEPLNDFCIYPEYIHVFVVVGVRIPVEEKVFTIRRHVGNRFPGCRVYLIT